MLQGGAGACMRQAGGCDGRDLGSRRCLLGRWWSRLCVVRDGFAKRAAGRVHLFGGGVPAACVGRVEEMRGGVLGARAWNRGRRRWCSSDSLLNAFTLMWRVAHAHDASASADQLERPGVVGRHRARRSPHPYGDRVLVRTPVTVSQWTQL